ncbi:LamG-like jellyroll fold domain-containing protein [Hymenobacter guriensis]|uniref:T9SS type A sorting domain-containing protein n=1 Tax=Hymenobacter guriensis TaxID=2793065 RepID=A0ABS0KW27_9BACT|nr:LamG-like jellyroll fold domain-containing protein [Hymenobacter guriensis]MBG8551970.1 T9SS type A sorting domain-containing protein [Hymenobacter guriensis]
MKANFLRKASLLTLLGAGLTFSSQAQRGGHFLSFTSQQDDQVTVPNFTLPASGPFSLEAWVYYNGSAFSTAGSFNTVLEFGNDNPWFGVNSDSQVEFYSGLEGGTVPVRTWAHLAYTWDGTTGTVYLNGEAVGTSTATPDRLGSSLGIGFGSSDTGWQGYIDEVMVWNVARTQAQIKSEQANGPGNSPVGLLAYFRFNETSGQTVLNQANPTLNGVLGSTSAAEANDPVWTNEVSTANRLPTTLTARLQPNFPNPFVQATTIPFVLSRPGHVELRVLDVTGRAVATLVNEPRPAGTYTIPFTHSKLAAGVYYTQLTLDGQSTTQRMVVQ